MSEVVGVILIFEGDRRVQIDRTHIMSFKIDARTELVEPVVDGTIPEVVPIPGGNVDIYMHLRTSLPRPRRSYIEELKRLDVGEQYDSSE